MQIKINKKYTLIPAIIIVVAIVFFVGLTVGKSIEPKPTISERIFFNRELGKPEKLDFSLFWQALGFLEEEYVDAEKIDYQNLLYGAIEGMTNSIGDDYTIFMKPEKSESFIKSVSGNDSFEGVGIELGMKNKLLTVVSPLENTPAYFAGIKAGDIILKIDETPTDGMLTEEAVSLIRGKKGTQVSLTIARNGLNEPKKIVITRDVIEVPVMKWEMKGDVAYVKIYHFTGNLPSKFENVVSEILQKNTNKIIIDVRNNPGGYLEASNEIASWFLPKNAVVLQEVFKNGETNEYKSKGYNAFQNFSVVILVNQGSASASEILAGALRDQRGIKLIGEKTFGKGSVQQMETFKDGSSLKITVAKWLTPSGTSIADEGLVPDIEVGLSEDDYNNNKDPQLEKALEVINQ